MKAFTKFVADIFFSLIYEYNAVLKNERGLGMKELKKFMGLLACGSGLLFQQQAQADLWVGSDANLCDYSSIQAALDEAENGVETIIRVASDVPNETYFENLNLATAGINSSLSIVGGYDQCQGVATEFSTIIDGSNSAPVFNITGNGIPKTLSISKFVMKNGLYDVVTERSGGLNIVGAELRVFMSNLTINQNSGFLGGGMFLSGLGQDIYLNSVNLVNNTAQNGGGLACESGLIFFKDPSAISFNSAISGLASAGNGGGAHISSGCHLIVQSGDESVAGIKGLIGNQASNHGGGVYVHAGGRLSSNNSDGVEPVIKDNIADADNNGVGNGGGIFVTDSTSSVEFRQGILANNQAANGGAAAVNDEADIRLFQNSSPCFKDQPCTEVTGNQAGKNVTGNSVGAGGAFYASNEGTILILRSVVKNNLADSGVVAAVNTGGSISFIAAVIADNGDLSVTDFAHNYLLVAVDDNSQISMTNTTVANNEVSVGSNHLILTAFGGRSVTKFSIIQDDFVDVLDVFNDSGQATFVSMECNVLHETQSISGVDISTDNLATTAVDFVAPNSGDYHLLGSSVAIDLCDDSAAWNYDIDGDLWGYDDPNVDNVNGVFDAGADETYSSDIVFKNGFE